MMIRRILIVMLAVLVFGLVGCGDDEPQAPAVKTEAELKTEAEAEITAETLDAELDKLEAEIDADQE
ncbi:MAG: hypothetical protein ACYSUT_04670 [Planctomycetota bacterium]|jgi:hypothetical protein